MEESFYRTFEETLCACTKLAVVRGVDFFEITDDNGIVLITVDFRNKEYSPSIDDDSKYVHICCPDNVTDVIKVFIELGIFEINESFINQKAGCLCQKRFEHYQKKFYFFDSSN